MNQIEFFSAASAASAASTVRCACRPSQDQVVESFNTHILNMMKAYNTTKSNQTR
jgi:hypothetical protein